MTTMLGTSCMLAVRRVSTVDATDWCTRHFSHGRTMNSRRALKTAREDVEVTR